MCILLFHTQLYTTIHIGLYYSFCCHHEENNIKLNFHDGFCFFFVFQILRLIQVQNSLWKQCACVQDPDRSAHASRSQQLTTAIPIQINQYK